MSIELKPCPFCGADPHDARHIEYGRWAVTCRCGASGVGANTGPNATDAAKIKAYQDARSAWNTRTTIKQAEAQQPATGEPVASRNPFASRCYTMSESHLSGHRLIVGFEKLGDAQDAHEWVARHGRGDFTHTAPSVPDGYMLVKTEDMVRLVNLIGPAPVEHGGKTFTFNMPNPEENLRLISATVRSMLARTERQP